MSSNRGGNPCLGSLIVASGSFLGRRDAESFAVQYLMQEFMKNYDTELNSQYVFISDGGKINAGPAWDFGISMYSPYDTPMNGAELLHIESLIDEPKVAGDMWFGAIDSHEEVHELIKKIYTEEFYYKAKRIVEEYKDYADELAVAANMDACLWTTSSNTFTEEAANSTDWMLKRLDFLYDYYLNEEEYCLVTFKTGLRYDAVLPVKRGDNLGWIPSEGTWKDESGINAQEGILIEKDMIFFIFFAPGLSCGLQDLQSSLLHADSFSCGM